MALAVCSYKLKKAKKEFKNLLLENYRRPRVRISDLVHRMFMRCMDNFKVLPLQSCKPPYDVHREPSAKILNKYSRWSIKHSSYNFTKKHHPEKLHLMADALSRKCKHGGVIDILNMPIYLIENVDLAALQQTEMETPITFWFQRISAKNLTAMIAAGNP